jgi:ABC-type multidrug transport system ATPase subunit
VEQQDIHMPEATVREALEFSAAMRLPDGVTNAQRYAFIDEVRWMLDLKISCFLPFAYLSLFVSAFSLVWMSGIGLAGAA